MRGASGPVVTVVVADDHDVVRVGLFSALRSLPAVSHIRIVGQARTAAELALVVEQTNPQVVVLDLQLGDGSEPGETVEWLVKRGVRLLIYSIADDPGRVRQALAAGAHGLSRKSEPIRVTLEKIRRVADGEVMVSAEILAMIDGDDGFVTAKLSAREREVLQLYVSGLEVPQIAAQLFVTENSAKEYLRRIRAKYGEAARPASTKVDLLRRAIEDGIVPPIQPR